jgi:hypothetical protein
MKTPKEKELNSIMRDIESYVRKYKVKEFNVTWKYENKGNDFISMHIKNPT